MNSVQELIQSSLSKAKKRRFRFKQEEYTAHKGAKEADEEIALLEDAMQRLSK